MSGPLTFVLCYSNLFDVSLSTIKVRKSQFCLNTCICYRSCLWIGVVRLSWFCLAFILKNFEQNAKITAVANLGKCKLTIIVGKYN